MHWLSSRVPGLTDIGCFSAQQLLIGKDVEFPRGATIGSGRMRRALVDQLQLFKKMTVLRHPIGVLLHKQLLELAGSMAERLVVLDLGDIKVCLARPSYGCWGPEDKTSLGAPCDPKSEGGSRKFSYAS